MRAKIINVETLDSSINGNPRYSVTIETEDGKCITGKTATDSTLAYRLPEIGATVECHWHNTRSGNVIFDNIRKA